MHRSGVFLPCLFLWACTEAEPDRSARVERVQSVQAITVSDGEGAQKTLLIAGILGPDRDLAPEAAIQARQQLNAWLAEAALSHTPTGEPDRYGRTPSDVRLSDGTDLAVRLVETGHAIVWPRPGQGAGFDVLLAAEARARTQSAGGWSAGGFAVRDPDPNRLAPYLDSAQIVQGRVISTGSARDGRVFINFGLDWRTDFTVVADEDTAAQFLAAGTDLSALDGSIIRVRGWLYELNGPSISLQHVAQVELVDAPSASTLLD
jgi:micrococcal nuclease